MVRVLNRHGFIVDIVDRTSDTFSPKDKYDLFIGLGAGNSGKYFIKYAQQMPHAIKIILAAGPEPTLSNQLVLEQYQRFYYRTGINAPPMRLTDKINFNEVIKFSDYIFCYGEIDQFACESYSCYNVPVFPIMPGTNPNIQFLPSWLKMRRRNHFLCFAGNGFICKGVDLVVEAFLQMPDCILTICGPSDEKAFFDTYGKRIADSPNIQYVGFLQVAGDKFAQLCSDCSFVIFHSSSEACSTSVATVMSAGLVPVINPETGISVGDFGFLMINKDDRITDIMNTVRKVILMDQNEYTRRVYGTLSDSLKYTQSSFTESFTRALLDVMQREMNYQKK